MSGLIGRRGEEGRWLHSPWGLSEGGGWLWTLWVIGGALMVALSVYIPLAPLVLFALSVGAYVLYQAPWLSLVAFALGVSFDDVYVNIGFALLGMGDLAMALLLALWTLRRVSWRAPLRLPEGWGFLFAFLVFTFLSLIFGPKPQVAYGLMLRLCVYVLTILVIVDYVRTLRGLHHILSVVIVSGVIHAGFAFYLDNQDARLVGIPDQSNNLGALLGFSLSLAFAYLKHHQSSPLQRSALLAGIFITMTALIFTISRGSYLSTTLMIVWLFQRYWRQLFTAGLFIVAAVGVYYYLDPDRFRYMLERLQFEDQSVTNRWQVVLNAIELIQTRPVFGIGFGQFAFIDEVIAVDAEAGRSPHNFYLGMFASIGLLGAGSLFAFILLQGRCLWREVRLFKRSAPLRLRGETVWPILLGEALQAAMIFQTFSLIFRGIKRTADWMPLGLYIVAYLCLREQRYAQEARSPEEPQGEADREGLV